MKASFFFFFLCFCCGRPGHKKEHCCYCIWQVEKLKEDGPSSSSLDCQTEP